MRWINLAINTFKVIPLMPTTKIQIGPADIGRTMTLEEFREAEEASGYLYELARGVLDVVEIPGDSHAQIVHNLHELLSDYRRSHPGLILRIGHGSDIRVIIPVLDSDRHPDLGVVFHEDLRDARGRRRASLVVEVVSPGKIARKRDYEEKLEEYLAFGILEYWIVDPEKKRISVCSRRMVGEVASWVEHVFQMNEPIRSELLQGFEANVADLWVDAGLET